MNSFVDIGPSIFFETIDSTQDEAIRRLDLGEQVGLVFALEQTHGRGRFERKWISNSNSSLSVSIVFPVSSGNSQPWCIGMAVACAAARSFSIGVQWPNDLVKSGQKVGGILTEIRKLPDGTQVAVVGIGLNLSPQAVPAELTGIAGSIFEFESEEATPRFALELLLEEIRRFPEPESWSVIQPIWALYDQTEGKIFQDAQGNRGYAAGYSSSGEILIQFPNEIRSLSVAEALWEAPKV